MRRTAQQQYASQGAQHYIAAAAAAAAAGGGGFGGGGGAGGPEAPDARAAAGGGRDAPPGVAPRFDRGGADAAPEVPEHLRRARPPPPRSRPRLQSQLPAARALLAAAARPAHARLALDALGAVRLGLARQGRLAPFDQAVCGAFFEVGAPAAKDARQRRWRGAGGGRCCVC